MKEFKKVLLKLSGEALAGNNQKGFSQETVLKVGEQVKVLLDKGIQVGIVIGGGNFWRGRQSDDMDRTKADEIGILATVMNSLYTAEMFRTIGIKTSVMTSFPIGEITIPFSKFECLKRQEEGEVVFFAGGIGHPYFSTDTAAALRAIETEADVILLAKNVDGVYDSDPKENPNAVKFDKISLREVIDKNLKVMDLTAAIMCLEQNVAMSVFHLNEENSIVNATLNKANGTLVYV